MDEQQRLATFDHDNFPKQFHITPEDFAKAGFKYTGESDVVVCVFGGCKMNEWEIGDDPMVEHEHYFRNCPFVTGDKDGEDAVDGLPKPAFAGGCLYGKPKEVFVKKEAAAVDAVDGRCALIKPEPVFPKAP